MNLRDSTKQPVEPETTNEKRNHFQVSGHVLRVGTKKEKKNSSKNKIWRTQDSPRQVDRVEGDS